MRFDDESRTRVYVDVTVTIDPALATAELELDGDGTWHATDWQSAAVHHAPMGELPERWTRRARTQQYFAGPEMASPAGAVVLPLGRHETQVRVSVGGDVIVGHASVIDVDE